MPREHPDVVGHEDDRHPVAEPVQNLVELCLCRGIHVDRRFVEEEHLRVADERPGDDRPLLLPAREVLDLPVGEIGDLHRLERLLCPGMVFFVVAPWAAGDVAETAGEDHLPHGDRILEIERPELRDVAEILSHRRIPAAEDPDLAAAGGEEPEDHPEERRLPAAVRPDDGVEIVRVDGEVHALKHGLAAQPDPDVVDLDHGGAHGLPLPANAAATCRMFAR